MLNAIAPKWVLGSWFAAVGVIVAWSVAVDARLSMTALLLVVGVAPAIVMLLLQAGAPSPTVAEIIHAADTPDDRRSTV